MNILIDILLIAGFCTWFAEVGVMPLLKTRLCIANLWYVKRGETKYQRRIKPFDCALCLSWWSGLIYFLIILHSPIAIIYGGICSLIAVLITKLLNK